MKGILLANKLINVGNEVIDTILSVIVVFLVLFVIIVGTYYISKLIDRSENNENKKEPTPNRPKVVNRIRNTNITDDDMMVAVLVATIDFRNEVKEDVRLVDVREIN